MYMYVVRLGRLLEDGKEYSVLTSKGYRKLKASIEHGYYVVSGCVYLSAYIEFDKYDVGVDKYVARIVLSRQYNEEYLLWFNMMLIRAVKKYLYGCFDRVDAVLMISGLFNLFFGCMNVDVTFEKVYDGYVIVVSRGDGCEG